MAMTLVSTTTVGSGGAASIEFTNIPQTGKDLLVLVSGRGSSSSLFNVRPNGSTSNLSGRFLQGDGSAAESSTFAQIWGRISSNTQTANTFGNASIYISNYAIAAAKSASSDSVNENNGTSAAQTIVASSWNDTTAISSLTLVPSSGNFDQHSTASLYLVS